MTEAGTEQLASFETVEDMDAFLETERGRELRAVAARMLFGSQGEDLDRGAHRMAIRLAGEPCYSVDWTRQVGIYIGRAFATAYAGVDDLDGVGSINLYEYMDRIEWAGFGRAEALFRGICHGVKEMADMHAELIESRIHHKPRPDCPDVRLYQAKDDEFGEGVL